MGTDDRASGGTAALSLLADGIVVADGSTGTALEALAPGLGERAALLPLENPALLESLHAAYFAAGSDLVETATFTASARGLARLAASGGTGGNPYELAYRVNRAAAEAAVRAARAAEAVAGGRRLVAGSIGPGDEPPSLGASSWSELRDSYLPQARGLADGGADLALVETCQDPLQAKAAIAALVSPAGGRGLPFIVSATVDGRGKLLAGTSIAAFVAIMAPFRPLAIGLNCSGGPDELEGPLAELSAISPVPICFMPNAGLPRSVDGRTAWPVGPAEFGPRVAALARRYGVAVVGGCCGTGPEHIRSLARELAAGFAEPVPRPRPVAAAALASLYEARPIGPGLFRIGERANAAGSAAFAAALGRDDFEAMGELALAQEGAGAAALDLHMAKAGRDEVDDLAAMVGALASRARAALCLDTSDPAALERALPLVGGRPLINSASLEDPERARRIFSLAREHGAAVVCLAVDGSGPARAAEDKARVCRSLYDMAVGEAGLAPESLLFDAVTFTAAAGPAGAAAETLRAIPLVKAACPGSLTVLGVGNISYGLPRRVRPAVTAVFLGMAIEAGLDAAILDSGGIPDPASLEPATRDAASALIRGQARADYDPLAVLLGFGDTVAPSGGGGADGAPETPADPEEALARAVSRGDGSAAVTAGRALVGSGGADRVAATVARAMGESGRLWSEGSLPLPLVLRSAEAARKVLSLAAESGSRAAGKGTVVMATVEGDLHDIGKNIASAIIACSGWRVVDLGTDVSAARIVAAAAAERAMAVGLSGLLTRSLDRMREACAALDSSGSRALVLCGGAAADPAYAARVLEPEHRGLVLACPDAFAAVRALDAGAGGLAVANAPSEREPAPRKDARPIAPRTEPAFVPPRLGAFEIGSQGLDELLARVDAPTLFGPRWGYRREDYPAARAEFDVLVGRLRDSGFPGARALGGFFRCRRSGESILEIEDPAGGPPHRFPFPVESAPPRRCLAAYFAEQGDVVGLLAVSVPPELSRAAAALRAEGSYEEYWRLHGLGSALAEAAAELAHARLSAEMAAAGSGCPGRRYSFGFPACPGVEHQGGLLALLGAERIGLSLTSGFQLSPEHSVTAFIVARPDAEYFSI